MDYEHQSDRQPDQRSGPVPAAGWIKELRADASGLWGRVDWTAQARELIAGKAYRYLGPSFYHTKAGHIITRLKGAGLVHRPALQLHALARQEETMNQTETLLDRLIAALGLPEGTTEDALFALIETLRGKAEQAVAAQKPDPARFVPIEAVQELMTSHHADRSERAKDRAAAKVKDALARGFITPAMQGWATAPCAQDEASFDSFMASSAPAYAHLMAQAAPNNPPQSSPAEIAQSDCAAAVCTQLGLKPGALSA
ncbi:phage protease [Sedimentitalea sp. HM32M-2]|uniref:phage protease n=1 Tax=Sedimentitalea sp. HM32M-2 TaxID=3351566 RepID=UPI0036D21A0E